MCQFRSLCSPSFAPLSVSAEFRSIFAFRLIFKKISKIAKRERFHSSAPHMLSIFFSRFRLLASSREFRHGPEYGVEVGVANEANSVERFQRMKKEKKNAVFANQGSQYKLQPIAEIYNKFTYANDFFFFF